MIPACNPSDGWMLRLLTPLDAFFSFIRLDDFKAVVDPPLLKLAYPIVRFNQFVSDHTVQNPQQTMYLSVKIICFYLGLFYRVLIPRSWHKFKYCFNLIAGLLVVVAMYQSVVLYLLSFGILGYLCMTFLPRGFNRQFSFYFFHVLSFCVIVYDQIKCPSLIRYGWVTGFMHMTIKITSVAICLHDYEVLEGSSEPQGIYRFERTKKLALECKPSALKYFSFLFFHANVLNPPPFEYRHYVNSIEDPKENSRGIDWLAILQRVVGIAVYMSFVSFCTKRLGWHDHMIKYEHYSEQPLSTFGLFWLGMTHTIFMCCKLQLAGMFAETILIVSGVGYTPDGPEGDRWWHIRAVNPLKFEFSPSMRTKIQGWNIAVEKYFRYDFYFRLPFQNRMLKRFMTGFLAAFWHGYYPGYFLFYAIIIALSQANITLYRKLGLSEKEMEFSFSFKQKHLLLKLVVGLFNSTIAKFLMSVMLLQTWHEIVLFHGVGFKWISLVAVAVIFVCIQYIMPQAEVKKQSVKVDDIKKLNMEEQSSEGDSDSDVSSNVAED